MILTSHAIIGAAVSNAVPNYPEIGFLLAFLSHYIADSIPHNQYDIDNFIPETGSGVLSLSGNRKGLRQFFLVLLDFFVGLMISIILFVRNEQSLLITLLGVAGGVLPDFLLFLYFKLKKEPFVFLAKIHSFVQCKEHIKNKPILASLFQIMIVVFFVITSFLIIK